MAQLLMFPLHTLLPWMSAVPGFVHVKVRAYSLSYSIWPRLLPFSDVCTHILRLADCKIIGVEITDAAHAVNTQPFHGNTAFMLGNEVWHAHTSSLHAPLPQAQGGLFQHC